MAGYPATPLWKKLGYTHEARAWVVDAPAYYANILALPSEVKISWLKHPERGMKFVHVFSAQASLFATIPPHENRVRPARFRHAHAP